MARRSTSSFRGGFNAAACRVVGIAGYVAIQPRDAGHAVHAVVGVGDSTPIGVGHGGLVAVVIVGIGNHVTVDIRHGDEIALPVVLVNNRSLGAGNLRHHAKLVVAAVDGLPVAYVLGEQAAGLVVLKGKHGSVRFGDGGKPALRRVAVLHPVAQRVRLAGRVAVLIVGVAGYLAKGVRHLGDVVQRVIGIGGLAAQFVHYGDEPVHLVVLVLLRVASLLKILLLKY